MKEGQLFNRRTLRYYGAVLGSLHLWEENHIVSARFERHVVKKVIYKV